MRAARRRRLIRRIVCRSGVGQRGFSLLELAVVTVVISILFVIAANKLLDNRVAAERTSMESIIGTLRSALNIKVASYLAKDNIAGLVTLEGTNPMNALSELPRNYRGELDAPDPRGVEGGSWYYDKHDKTLVYRVDNSEYFSGGLSNPARARFAVRLVYQDLNRNGRFERGVDKVDGVRLAELESYAWVAKKQ